ncbi:WxcM-like domain-containing protein [Kaistella sp. G5-32]|uniref:WxcM-like domain-containing protein n=1 Tax=Kaistella gelatinilytica TaxID=2787636 RepID=A0ABS0FBW0_9FLAO|nr:WxcM-like domain-containing protein [Kaistella gelatinilytica]MBF8457194.1 WxcM-like domain-containing protein [Kaistella gelatinilytica]
MEPTIIKGNHFKDDRGTVIFNNDFNALGIKRVYTLENNSTDFARCWQGHKIEQRWFSAISGSFTIKLIEIDLWENPSKDLKVLEFVLSAENLDVLHIPKGFVTSIQADEEQSKLLVFADYELGEIKDEFRFPADYFN